ncbi:MAG: hypothetical protein AAF411_05875, partial [Myxococcota bacterium]
MLVLDYTAARVFEDGSSLVLTHEIFRAQSEESVDALGEFHMPEGGRILRLETRKADGQRLEPELIDDWVKKKTLRKGMRESVKEKRHADTHRNNQFG